MIKLCFVCFVTFTFLVGTNVYAQESGLEVESGGNIEQIRNPLDFISHMNTPLSPDGPKTKEAVLKSLGRLTAGGNRDSNPDLVEAWNLLKLTDALSTKEKADWVEQRMADLPPPFVMLAAVCRSNDDPKRGMELYLFSRLRLTIDAAKCADPSVEDAAMRVVEDLLPQFNVGLNRSPATDEKRVQRFVELMRHAKAGALSLHENVANHVPRPWWIAHAGAQEIISLLVDQPGKKSAGDQAESLFKPEKEWPRIEKEIVQGFKDQLSR